MKFYQHIYVYKILFKSSTLKNDESNSNINIFKILYLPFDMLCYFLKSKMILCKMH